MGHKDEEGKLLAGQLGKGSVLKALQLFLQDEKLPKLGHNLKFDYAIIEMQGEGITLKGPLWDTMIGAYLLDPGRRTFKLDDLCREILDLKLTAFSEVTKGDKRPDSFVFVGLEDAKNYSCEDVYGACLLWEEFRPKLEKQKLWSLFADLETPLVPILAEMELAGIKVDIHIFCRNCLRNSVQSWLNWRRRFTGLPARNSTSTHPGSLGIFSLISLNCRTAAKQRPVTLLMSRCWKSSPFMNFPRQCSSIGT